jgi:hypothetical protein
MAIEAQLAGARDRISTELRRIVSSTQTELKRAVQLEQELAARLAQLKVRQGDLSNEMVTLRELEREAAAQRAVYEAFLLRARETGEQKDINTANMSVISKAWPPLNANPPSRSTIVVTFTMLGFFAGVGFGAMRGAYESLRDTANARMAPQKIGRRELPGPSKTPEDEPVGTGTSLKAARETADHFVVAEGPTASPFPTGATSPAEPEPQDWRRRDDANSTSRETPMQGPVYAYPYFGSPHPAPVSAYPAQPHGYPLNYPSPPPQPVYSQPSQPQPYGAAEAAAHAMPFAPTGYRHAPDHAPHWQQPQTQTHAPAYYPYPPQQAQPPAGFYPAYMPPQTLFPQHAAAQPYAHPPAPPAPAMRQEPPQPAAATLQAPIDEIRSSLREFREAVRDLADSRQRRRYF